MNRREEILKLLNEILEFHDQFTNPAIVARVRRIKELF